MPEEITCKTKAAALAALAAIAEPMRGMQKDALRAVAAWITETISNDVLPEEVQKRIESIFQGTPGEQKGRAWLHREMEDPKYTAGIAASDGEHYRHITINTPENGSELLCFYCAETKQWEPVGYYWPPVEPQSEFPDNEEKEE